MRIVAVDIAILLPPPIASRAIELSAALPADQSQGLLLGDNYLPHITLLQMFVEDEQLPDLLARVGDSVGAVERPLPLRVTGGAMGSRSVWMAIERTPALFDLHLHLLDVTTPLDRGSGDATAFFGDDARERDVQWVTGYRRTSSGHAFTPHITLGHAASVPAIEPFTFDATLIAACHLGRFCSCRHVLRAW
jgi:2'-5' RNA ligase